LYTDVEHLKYVGYCVCHLLQYSDHLHFTVLCDYMFYMILIINELFYEEH